MGFQVKFLLYFALLMVNFYCFAGKLDDYPLTKTCYLQYLHEKEKLNEPFERPQSRCRLVVEFFANNTIDIFTESFTSKVEECVKNNTITGGVYDYYLKLYVLEYSNLTIKDAERITEVTSNNVSNVVNEIKVKCNINGTAAEKNSTLEDQQLKYCQRKYVLDNHLLEVENVDVEGGDINPDRIDTDSVNCTNIIAVERSKSASQFKDKLSTGDCVMNEFGSDKLFDWKVVLTTYKVWEDVIPDLMNVIGTNIEEFLGMPTSECVV